MRIESKEIAKALDSNDGAGDGISFRNRMLEKNLQGFPGAAAEGGNEVFDHTESSDEESSEY